MAQILQYSEKVIELFFHPKNKGEITDEDLKEGERLAVGEYGSIACGDLLRFTMKVDEKTDYITGAKFETFGCGSAIASSSALTEIVLNYKDEEVKKIRKRKGLPTDRLLTVDEASKIDNKDLVAYLYGLPKEKMHCSVMGREALELAIADYKGITPIVHEDDDSKLICKCFNITYNQIYRVVRENNLSVREDVTNYIKAGGGCESCHNDIEDILRDVQIDLEKGISRLEEKIEMTNLEKIEKIKGTINKEIRPRLQADGGDIQLIDIEGDTVKVKMLGQCVGCMASYFTIEGVQEILREYVTKDIKVEQVFR